MMTTAGVLLASLSMSGTLAFNGLTENSRELIKVKSRKILHLYVALSGCLVRYALLSVPVCTGQRIGLASTGKASEHGSVRNCHSRAQSTSHQSVGAFSCALKPCALKPCALKPPTRWMFARSQATCKKSADLHAVCPMYGTLQRCACTCNASHAATFGVAMHQTSFHNREMLRRCKLYNT